MSEELDGCELDFTENATTDDQIDSIVLYADIDPSNSDAIKQRKSDWEVVLNA